MAAENDVCDICGEEVDDISRPIEISPFGETVCSECADIVAEEYA